MVSRHMVNPYPVNPAYSAYTSQKPENLPPSVAQERPSGNGRGEPRKEACPFFCSLLQTIVLDRRMMDLFDLEAAEKAESQIDAFILKRSRERDDANRIEEAWKESTRRVNEKRLRENRDAWAAHYEAMYRTHARLASDHAARALALRDNSIGGGDDVA